jgi:hypothetical protein
MNKHSIQNKIKQPSQCCVHCGKMYKTRTNLEKHLMLCELLKKKSSTFISDEEDIPSQRILYQMIVELGQKYNRLEEKVEEINKWVVKKKKKINILDWLNTNIQPNISFENLSDKIFVTDEHIEFLFSNSFNDTLNEIFSNSIYRINEVENPIFAFVQKSNVFYSFDKLEEQEVWLELSREKLIRFLNKIQMKISKKLYEWKKNHSQQIRENDKLSEICDKATIKIMSVEFKQESTLNKVKQMIYARMKTDLKALIEYDFEF